MRFSIGGEGRRERVWLALFYNAVLGGLAMDALIYTLLLIVAFVGIVVWAFGRKRKARFERDARIPFEGDKR